MTMRYTHIGIDDQARALKQLPWSGPQAAGFSEPRQPSSSNGAQHSGSESDGGPCHSAASGDSESDGEVESCLNKNPLQSEGYVAKCPSVNAIGTKNGKWRRRESNLDTIPPQATTSSALAKTANDAALHMRCIKKCFQGRFLATLDAPLQRVVEQWQKTPEAIKTAIVALMKLN